MNRKHRRALERVRRSKTPSDAEALQARVVAAQQEVQRLNAMHQVANQALVLAKQIHVVPPDPTATEAPSVEDDPNFFRTAATEDFEERVALTRVKLIGAIEELYLAWDACDPADQPLVRVAPTIVTP